MVAAAALVVTFVYSRCGRICNSSWPNHGCFRCVQLRYWKSSEGWNKKKEVEIVLGEELHDHGPQIKVALSDLPAYTALRAHVAVMNSHYTGPFSDLLDFFTPEGGR